MLSLTPAVKLYACTEPTDMRRSFNGLAAMVENVLQLDPYSGHLFIFFNRRRQHCRILFWDRTGFVMIAKRLEKGRFRVPWEEGEAKQPWTLEAAELTLILEGIDLRGAGRRARWQPPAEAPIEHDKKQQKD